MRVLVPTAVLFAVTLGLMAFAAIKLHDTDLDRARQARSELIADIVERGLRGMMLRGEPSRLPALFAALVDHRTDVDSVSMLNAEGLVTLSSSEVLVGTRPFAALDGIGDGRLIRHVGQGGRQDSLVRPIRSSRECAGCHVPDRLLGYLDLRLSHERVTAARRRLAKDLALTGIPALVLLLAGAWWLVSREAIHPIRRLAKAMRAAESGDASIKADEGREDEIGIAARCFDGTMTALRRSRAELEATYRERMQRADRFATVGELATGLAHEIKNPLAGLSGALEILAADLREAPTQGEMVEEMRHQVQRLTRIMESLLSYARPPKLQLAATDVNGTLHKVLFLVTQQRGGTPDSVRVERDLAADLPHALADPAQLEQVFLNLCLNAVQAMNGRGGTLTVRSRGDGERIAVDVVDTGQGIAPEIRANLFKPFFTTRREGTGLGLAISQRIIADHGGAIEWRCPEAGGTAFTVILQRANAAAAKVA